MSGECILVIDDSEEMVRHLTEDVLPSFGYKTIHAYDGQNGLALIHNSKPDLIMLDYNLPKMTGIDVLQQMAQESISTPVVLMTGYGSELSAIKAFRLGAKDYLIKPFTVDEVVETIDRALVETRLLHDKAELAEQLRRVKIEMSRQTNEMKTLFNIGKAITALLSVNKVMERVLEAATYLINSEESIIWLPDETGMQLRAYEKSGLRASETAVSDLSISNSPVGQVMRTGRPLRQSIFTGQGIKLKSDDFARSVLCVPLKLRGMTVGVLSVSNLTALRSFSKRDEFLLSFLADYAAIALENARVFQAADQALAARLEELNTLIEITRTITSSINLKEVVQLTINQVHDSWHISASSLWLLDESRGVLKVLANVGTSEKVLGQIEVPLSKGIVGNVAQSGKWIVTNDARTHPLHYRQVDSKTGFQTESILCVPLLSRGKVIGALQLLNKQDGDFDDQDVERALSIAAAVAIAVANALLFNESESRKHQLEVTLEHNKNPILITDADNKLHILNQEARSRLHLTAEAIGKSVTDIIQHPVLADLLTNPNPPPADELVLSDGTIWLPQIALIPEHGRILILQNITELRELDQAKDLFLAAVSHDMRDPLNNINDFATSLSAIGTLNENQTQYVNRIVQATGQMMELVNDLLELARINTQNEPTKQLCNIVEIVTEVIQTQESNAAVKDIPLILTSSKDVHTVSGDPKQLRRAISNLIDNAIKFSPNAHPVNVTIYYEKQMVSISILDQGNGISVNDLPHIFDKFYRGHSPEGLSNGTGLGLTLAQSIAEAHDGHINVQLLEQGGSEFVLTLPAAHPH